jgi:hypothetical protein
MSYAASRGEEKSVIAVRVIDWWKSLKPPGRFLKRGKDSASWFEVEDGNEVRLVVQRMLCRSKPDNSNGVLAASSPGSGEVAVNSPDEYWGVDEGRRQSPAHGTAVF